MKLSFAQNQALQAAFHGDNTDEIDVWDTGPGPRFSDSGKVPVRWKADIPYEWWEDTEHIAIACTRGDFVHGVLAVH